MHIHYASPPRSIASSRLNGCTAESSCCRSVCCASPSFCYIYLISPLLSSACLNHGLLLWWDNECLASLSKTRNSKSFTWNSGMTFYFRELDCYWHLSHERGCCIIFAALRAVLTLSVTQIISWNEEPHAVFHFSCSDLRLRHFEKGHTSLCRHSVQFSQH